jgi:hypothetical protein
MATKKLNSFLGRRILNTKLLLVVLVGLLFCSTFAFAAAAKVQCPTCGGTGSIVCPDCQGTGQVSGGNGATCDKCLGSGIYTPRITTKSYTAEEQNGATVVTATFKNQETAEVKATVTATLSGHSSTSDVITFPPSQETTVTVSIDYVGNDNSMIRLTQMTLVKVTGIDNMACPYCSGTGTVVSQAGTCPTCLGAGSIVCTICAGAGVVEEALIAKSSYGVSMSTVEAAVAVVVIAVLGVAAFFVLKKRRVNEKSLRRYSSQQFNDWVLARLDGKSASSRETALGIDGYSRSGYPVLIKQSDDVGMLAIDNFAAALARNRSRNGVIVAYGFGGDAVRGRVRAQMNYKIQIEMLTVRELIDSKRTL